MRSSAALILLLVLSACALPQQRSRTFTPYQPLEAYITGTTSSGPLFHVNRPAYVAMFYIVPGSGVSMLYPGFGSGSLDGRVFAGSHFANTRITNRQHYIFTRGSYGQPRYYFLIASDRPLNVQQFGTFGDGLRSRLGTQFGSFSAYSTMTELAELALPNLVDDGSWTTDLYVDWPSVIYTEPARGRVMVRCGGYEMYVPRSYVGVVRSVMCEGNSNEDADREKDPDAPEGKKIVNPRTRQPLGEDEEEGRRGGQAITAAQRAAIRDRVASSTQLEVPAARDEIGRARGYGTRARPTPEGAWPAGVPGRASSSGSASASGASAARPATRPAASSGADAGSASRPSTRSGGDVATPSRTARPAPSSD